MNIELNIRSKTLSDFLSVCRDIKNGCLNEKRLHSLLDHPDYEVEFRRYRPHFSKEEFISYLLSDPQAEAIDEKQRWRFAIHRDNLGNFLEHLDLYEERLEKLGDVINTPNLETGIRMALDALPSESSFESVDFLITGSIGNSFGWPGPDPSRALLHMDFMQLYTYFDLDTPEGLLTMQCYIAHELQHVGYQRIISEIEGLETLPYDRQFILFLLFEGSAVFYCNNFPGHQGTAFRPELPRNIGLDPDSWAYLQSCHTQYCDSFMKHIDILQNADADTFNSILEFWLNGYRDDEPREGTPSLKHTPNYYMGAVLVAALHNRYGKDGFYDMLKSPREILASLRRETADIAFHSTIDIQNR